MALGGSVVSAGLGALPAAASRVASVTPLALPDISAPPDVVVGEADGYVTLPVTLSAPGTKTVSVNYRTTNNTATASAGCPYNYVGVSGTMNFAPGETTQVVQVDLVNCDTSKSSASGRSPSTSRHRSTGPSCGPAPGSTSSVTATSRHPGLYVRDATVDHQAGTVEVPVLLGGPSGTASNSTVTVHYATNDGTATGRHRLHRRPAARLTFGPGETAENITVPILDRSGSAPTRSFSVTLSSPDNATIVDGTGVVTIGASGATAGGPARHLGPARRGGR